MSDCNCPYCDAEVEICHDDGYGMGEDEVYQEICGKCGKTFVYTICFDISHYPKKADCLNGAEHKYERTRTYPPEFAKLRCIMCGETKPLPKEKKHE